MTRSRRAVLPLALASRVWTPLHLARLLKVVS